MTSLTTEPVQAPEATVTQGIRPDLAARRITADHDILLAEAEGLLGAELAAPYRVDGQRSGEFCDSLHDLLAHILMWDELALAVLSEARGGRLHWLVDARATSPEVATQISQAAAVAAGLLPPWLILHRLVSARDALTAEVGRVAPADWDGIIGRCFAEALTASGGPAFWHAAQHLRKVPGQQNQPAGIHGLPAGQYEIAQ